MPPLVGYDGLQNWKEAYMSERDLEIDDALTELSGSVRELKTEQEIRAHALALAVHCFLKPSFYYAPGDITTLAQGFYVFLSADGSYD